MLELRDRKYVLTTEDGAVVAAYWNVDDAKIDAQDIWEREGKKLCILEMTHSIEIDDGIFMKVYKRIDWEPQEKKEPEEENASTENEENKEEEKEPGSDEEKSE